MSDFAWNDVQLFLALYRARTMGRAADALKVDTSTVSRRLGVLETDLGTRLFDRGRNGLSPTDAAEDLLPAAEWAEEGMTQFARSVDGLEREIAGVVRIACPPDAAAVVLLPILDELSVRYPALELVLLPGEAVLDINRRQADIALRVVRPAAGELLVRRLMDITWRPAAKSNLAERVADGATLGAIPWIGWTEAAASMPAAVWQRRKIERAPVLRTDHMPTQVAAAVRGIGAVLLPEPSIAHYGLVPLPLSEADCAELPVDSLYLVAHQMLRKVPRVRVVWDAMAVAFGSA